MRDLDLEARQGLLLPAEVRARLGQSGDARLLQKCAAATIERGEILEQKTKARVRKRGPWPELRLEPVYGVLAAIFFGPGPLRKDRRRFEPLSSFQSCSVLSA